MKLDDFTYDDNGNVIPRAQARAEPPPLDGKPSPATTIPESIWRQPTRKRTAPKKTPAVPAAVWIAGGVVGAVALLGVVIACLSGGGSNHRPATRRGQDSVATVDRRQPVRLVTSAARMSENGGRLGAWTVETAKDEIFDTVILCETPSKNVALATLIFRQRGQEDPEVYLAGNFDMLAFDTKFPALCRFDKDEPFEFRMSTGTAGSAFMPAPDAFLRRSVTAEQVVLRLPEKGGNTLTLTFNLSDIHPVISTGTPL